MQSASIPEFAGSSRFVIRSRVGEGAVGVVYDALDRERNSHVAIKTLRSPSAETIHLLKNEFRALQDLRHKNLVSLGELFEEGGVWFFTMEFVQGINLLRYVRPGSDGSRPSLMPLASGKIQRVDPGRLDESRLRSVLGQLAVGLTALHQAGKVHRDVKPSNVLVTPEGRVVILDFGLVAALDDVNRGDHGMQGTVPYMSPEQASSEPVGFAADWYAVGVILYQALTGRMPFYGTANEILEDKVTREPPAPHELLTSVPADLDELCVQLLSIDPQRRPTDQQVLERLRVEGDDSLSSMRTQVFVGREQEQEALRAAFADVVKGGTVTVFVHGESGLGKSFLVRRFTEDLAHEAPGTLVLSGRCYERESMAYKAVDGIIDALSEWLRELPDAEVRELVPPNVGLLEKAFPVLGSVPGIAGAAKSGALAANPQQLRTYTFAALRGLLEAVARRQPLVLTIDDLQWADSDSLVLLAELLRPPSPPALLLVATLRLTTESHRPIGGERARAPRISGDVRHLELEHLSNEDAERMVEGLLEQLPHGDDLRGLIGSIVADTKGHPSFIDEVVHQGAARLSTSSGPMRLDDALRVRVNRLDPAARSVLEVVATAGLPIPQNVAAQAAAMDLGHLFRIVSHLRAEHLVRTSGMGRTDLIEPYHDRVRDSVTASLEVAALRDWHGRLALALEGWKEADPETLSNHWEGGGRTDRAQHYALLAAGRAEEALAFDHAARLYQRALELSETDEARTTIKGRLAEALTNAGQWALAADIRLELSRGAEPTASLDLRRLAAGQLMCSGHFDRGVGILQAALAESGVRDPQSRIGLLLALVFYRLLLALRGLAYRERQPTEGDRAKLVRADTARSAGAGFSMTDNIRGAYFQTRNLLMALRTGDVHRIMRALGMEVCFSATGGPAKHERTVRLLASTRALADRLGTGEALGVAATATGYTHYFMGQWPQAAQWLARGEEHFRDGCVGVTFELNSARLMLYRALAYQGELQELAARVPAVYREADQQGDLYTRINLRAGPLTLIGLAHDEPERVRVELLEATGWLPKTRFLIQHHFCWIARTQVDLYEGHPVAAHEHAEASWPPLARSLLLRVEAIRVAAIEQRGRCAVAAAAGGSEGLLAIAEAQARALEGNDLAWAQGSASLLLGGIEWVRGREGPAAARVEAAVRLFTEADMGLYRAVAQRRLGQLRGGDEGRGLVATSEAWMTARGVRDSVKLARVIAPGFPD